MTHGITELTPGRHIFGAGVWFRNYNTAQTVAQNVTAGRLIGATKGGNEVTIQRDSKNFGEELDGALGKIKGMTKLIKDTALMKATFAEISEDLLLDALPGCTFSADGSKLVLVPGEITDADFLDNIAWIGDYGDGEGNTGVIIKNPLSYEPLVLAPTDKDNATLQLAMEAHYDPADMSARPYELFIPNEDVS